jgi:asparagine synthase (glutamine-hydrolysing)
MLAALAPDEHTAREWLDPEAGVALAALARPEAAPKELRHSRSIASLARSTSGRYQLLFEGELHNRLELDAALTGPDRPGPAPSDATLALAAIERWGARAGVQRFNGPFVIALWDTRDRRLTLIRDRLGIKPLFIYARGGAIAFSSELLALVAGPGFERTVDATALTHYLRYLYIGTPRSIFQGVVKLGPGQILTITDPTAPLPTPETYWSLREVARQGLAAPFQGTVVEAADELDRLLSDAVRLQMQADVPIGALLSGGIDSSAVVALMQEQAARPVKTFTVAFDVAEHNEAHHAAQVARHLGTDHSEFLLTGRDALESVPRLPEIFDEPHADAGLVSAYLVCDLARREIEIALLGDGGDELYGGYNRYSYGEGAMERILRVPRPARRLMAAGINSLSAASWDRAHRALAPLLRSSFQQRLVGERLVKLGRLMNGAAPPQMYRTLVSAWQQPDAIVAGSPEQEGVLEEVLRASTPPRLVERMMLADQLTYLPGDQLVKADRVSKAAGLRVRAPLLDYRQVEFSWKLPLTLKISAGRGKVLLREVLHRRVPRELVERPKVGFSIPLAEWLRGPLRPWAEELLTHAALEQDGLLRAAPIRTTWQRFLKGKSESALALWAVLVYQAWRGHWLR